MPRARRSVTAAACAAVAAVVVAGCTSATTSSPPTTSVAAPTTSSPSPTSAGPTSAPSTASGPTPTTGSTDQTLPPGQSRTPPTASGPATYFTPADPNSYSMSGPFAVDQALQDPFSNLLQRGALHQHTVTLDVTGVPDEPWTAGTTTLLFGTCKCPQRGQGLHLTVTDPSAISDAGGGAVRIVGTFRPTVTAADAITLRPAT